MSPQSVKKEQIICLDAHKFVRPDVIHSSTQRELVEVLTKLFSTTYHQSWQTGKVPVDWRLVNVMPTYRNGQKEDSGNNRSLRPFSLELIPLELFKDHKNRERFREATQMLEQKISKSYSPGPSKVSNGNLV